MRPPNAAIDEARGAAPDDSATRLVADECFPPGLISIDTAEQVKPLLSAIRECKNLEELQLQGFSFGTVAAELLGTVLAEHGGTLKRAYWSDIFVSRTKEEVPIALSSMMTGLIKAGARLRTLDLSDNAFGAQGVQSLVTYFKSDLSSELEDLNLTNTGLGIGGAKVLSAALSHVNSDMKVIRIGRDRLENEGSIVLAEVFKKFSTLEVIEMPQNGICHQGVEALAEALAVNDKIEEFIFSDNTVCPKGAKALKRVLPKLNCLVRLYLDDCLLKNQGARYILESLVPPNVPMLMELNLSSNEITDNIGQVPFNNGIFWRNNIQLILCDNRLTVPFKEYLTSRIIDCDESEIIFGDEVDDEYDDDDEDEDEDYEETIEDEDEDDDEIDEEDEDDDVSRHTSDEGEANEEVTIDFSALNLSSVIPTTVNDDGIRSVKGLKEVISFLEDTSEENYLKLGDKPIESLLKHLEEIKDEEEYTDELVQMIFKLNTLDQDPKDLYSSMKSWEGDNSYRSSILANAFLVHLGLMKPENKKKQIIGNGEKCIKSFARVLKSFDVSTELKNTILFVASDKCSKEKRIGSVDSNRFLELLTNPC